MTYSVNYFFEVLRGLLTITGWYVLFYLRHKPASKLRRAVLLASFPVTYLAFMLIPLSPLGNTILWAAIILLFALLCGDLRESLFTAIYYIGIEACIDTLDSFIVRYRLGHWVSAYSIGYYVNYNLQYLIVLGWAFFYYWVLRRRQGKLPLRFWIMTIIPPLASAVLLTLFAETARPLQNDMGINIYPMGILIGLFLIAFNMFSFYMYARLLTYYESHLRAHILQGQMDVYARQIETIETAHGKTQTVRHEMKNLLLVLQAALNEKNYDEAQKRLNTVLGDLDAAAVKTYTGLTVIDAMLSYKAERLRPLGASLEVTASTLVIPDESAYDIASMLAIMLDNATDAALRSPRSDAPFAIRCDIKQVNTKILLFFRNPLSAPLRRHNGEIVSAKAESGHGLGLQSLHRLAEKYNGDVQISDTDATFTITILLFIANSDFFEKKSRKSV
jgi:signal transduction histidine kinase